MHFAQLVKHLSVPTQVFQTHSDAICSCEQAFSKYRGTLFALVKPVFPDNQEVHPQRLMFQTHNGKR